MTLYAHVRGVKASTPYGEMEFSDDDNSSLALEEFAKASGDYRTDSLNTRAIISVCEVADGALAEMMEHVCFDDFCNKPEIVVGIYQSDEKALEKYIEFIAIALYFNDYGRIYSISSNSSDELVGIIGPKVRDKDKIETLSIIIARIKCAYNKYKVILDD